MIKYIFSINTGRSGSNYLAEILKEVNDIKSFHEPHPIMNGKPMIECLQGNPLKMEQKIKEKINSINSHLGESKCYFETNHTFIKGFGWLIPIHYPHNELGIILLKRDQKDIIKSLYRVKCRPLSYIGYEWIMNPLMKNPINPVSNYDRFKYRLLFFISKIFESKYNLFRIKIDNLRIIKQFNLKYLDWYVKETYAQASLFKKKFPNIKIYKTTIDKLNDIHEFEKMFDFFELDFSPKASFSEKLNVKTNLKTRYNRA
ncbi:MAG: hypothetical protein GDA42_07315 [Ekhidna sp.]|nr:hypothetical protein [Ekhidna sp.]